MFALLNAISRFDHKLKLRKKISVPIVFIQLLGKFKSLTKYNKIGKKFVDSKENRSKQNERRGQIVQMK